MAKSHRKVSIKTLSVLAEEEDCRIKLDRHFVGLVRRYTERKQIEESSLITQFWGETHERP